MLSIATLNIHNFCDSEQLDSTYKLIHFFFYCQFDIIALQEVDDINKLKPIVGDYHYVYNRHNVILSKYPMEDLIQQKTKERYVSVVISLPNDNKVCVTNVHLNYKNEQIRTQEMETIQKMIDPFVEQYPSILLGDFNALTKRDYANKAWHEIYKTRKFGKWELPTHKLTDKIKKQWDDSKKYTGSPTILETCRYNTRIDYIYVTDKIHVFKYEVLQTIPHISDHNAVIIHISDSFN